MKLGDFRKQASHFFFAALGFGLFARSLPAADQPARPPITGVSQVALFVHDVEKSRAFYKGFLGFDEAFAVQRPNGALHFISIKINDRQAIELFPEKKAATDRLSYFALAISDAEAMRAYLASCNVKVSSKVGVGRIGNPHADTADPDGHVIEMVQYPPEGWTKRDAGKFMPTTRISPRLIHVGFLVGKLEPALKFYRDTLGFRETGRDGAVGHAPSWVDLKVPDGDDNVEFMPCEKIPTLERLGMINHLCLEVPDLAKAVEILQTRALPSGCKLPTGIKFGTDGRRQADYYDPDGTCIELMEPRPAASP